MNTCFYDCAVTFVHPVTVHSRSDTPAAVVITTRPHLMTIAKKRRLLLLLVLFLSRVTIIPLLDFFRESLRKYLRHTLCQLWRSRTPSHCCLLTIDLHPYCDDVDLNARLRSAIPNLAFTFTHVFVSSDTAGQLSSRTTHKGTPQRKARVRPDCMASYVGVGTS